MQTSVDQYLTGVMRATMLLIPVTLVVLVICLCVKRMRRFALISTASLVFFILFLFRNVLTTLEYDDITRPGHERYIGWVIWDYVFSDIWFLVKFILICGAIYFVFFHQKLVKRSAILLTVGAVFLAIFLYHSAKLFAPIDFSQNYRQVENWEGMVFADYQSEDNGVYYKRCVWGLKRVSGFDERYPVWEKRNFDEEAYSYIDGIYEEGIAECIFSPDKNYVLYSEYYDTSDGYSTGPFEYYYRVYDIGRDTVYTIYHGRERAYRIGWVN